YYGAARTENNHFGAEELEHLKKAGEHITPDRLHYYLAIQHHALENWDQALKLYNKFRVSVPEAEQKELELDKKIQLCFNQTNPFDSSSTAPVPAVSEDTAAEPTAVAAEEAGTSPALLEDMELLTASANLENVLEEMESQEQHPGGSLFLPREALPNLPGVKPTIPEGDPIQFQVNNFITYLYTSQFKTEEGKNLFEKAGKLELQQKKNIEETETLRKTYSDLTSLEEREAVANKIISLENESLYLEEEIRQTYSRARTTENDYWERADPVSRKNFLMKQEKLLSGLKEEEPVTKEPEEEILIDFIAPTPKAAEKTAPSELVYKIQIGAYSKGVPAYKQRLFNKLSVIRSIDSYTDEKGIVVYTTGNLSNYEDALIMRNQVRQEGIQDAQVVPYFKGKRITLEEAKQLVENNDI
ncbi:MAG: hypothetical protein ACOC0R_05410, partial [Mariniphaga sp.]